MSPTGCYDTRRSVSLERRRIIITERENQLALERIERALHDTPFCSCGEPTTVLSRDDGLWLGCSTLETPPAGILRRLVEPVVASAHIRRLIVDPTPCPVAA